MLRSFIDISDEIKIPLSLHFMRLLESQMNSGVDCTILKTKSQDYVNFVIYAGLRALTVYPSSAICSSDMVEQYLNSFGDETPAKKLFKCVAIMRYADPYKYKKYLESTIEENKSNYWVTRLIKEEYGLYKKYISDDPIVFLDQKINSDSHSRKSQITTNVKLGFTPKRK